MGSSGSQHRKEHKPGSRSLFCVSRSQTPSRNELLPLQVAAQVSEWQVIPAPSIGSRVICKAPLRGPEWRSAGAPAVGYQLRPEPGFCSQASCREVGLSPAPAACWVWARGHSNLGCRVDRSCRVSLELKDAGGAGGGGVTSRRRRSVGLPT